jgi:hypothetical protein
MDKIYLNCLLAFLTFFWLFVFVSVFPYPINLLLLSDITLALLLKRILIK